MLTSASQLIQRTFAQLPNTTVLFTANATTKPYLLNFIVPAAEPISVRRATARRVLFGITAQMPTAQVFIGSHFPINLFSSKKIEKINCFVFFLKNSVHVTNIELIVLDVMMDNRLYVH